MSRLDLNLVAGQTAATGHSTMGLIRAPRKVLPEHAREWVYYGATVQDLSDTWFALVFRAVGEQAVRHLDRIEAACGRADVSPAGAAERAVPGCHWTGTGSPRGSASPQPDRTSATRCGRLTP